MFNDIEAISGFSIRDAEATRDFYSNKLGMEVTDVPGMEGYGLLELHIKNGHNILMYQKEDHQPASFTVLSFPVSDINQVVTELSSKDVEMIKYDDPNMHQDDMGISRGLDANRGPDIAWFSDPSGNILAVMQNAA